MIDFTVLFNKSNTDRVAIVYVNIPIEDDDVVKDDRSFVVQLLKRVRGQEVPLPPVRVETQAANVSVMDDDGAYTTGV